MSARPQESATARLSRLLTMVPWLLAHQGVDIDTAAAQFGITHEQLDADLSLLFVCGTPGHLPDDLIEADWEDGRIFLGNADAISRPLRFTIDEALTLMVGLRALAPGASGAHQDAVNSALAKLETATGVAGGVASRVTVALPQGPESGVLSTVEHAIKDRRRIHLRYLSARDEVTDRDVDPIRLVTLDAHWYLEGWCHRAEAVRLFRVDRIESIAVLDLDGTPPAAALVQDPRTSAFVSSSDHQAVVMTVTPRARWVAEYYPAESVVDHPDGSRTITVRAADLGWVKRLAWRLGGELRVVSPPSLGVEVAAEADTALRAYAVPPPPVPPAAGPRS